MRSSENCAISYCFKWSPLSPNEDGRTVSMSWRREEERSYRYSIYSMRITVIKEWNILIHTIPKHVLLLHFILSWIGT